MSKKIKKPFFSIITCTYNSDKFLQQNINSVENQIFKNYEHIFVDGKSTDGTLEMIKRYNSKDQKVKLFSYPAKGISNAFNKGIKKAKGKYLFFLNSDDYFHDNKVLKNVSIFLNNNSELNWIFGKICEIDENDRPLGFFPTRKLFQKQNYQLLKVINFIPHQSVFMKQQVFDNHGLFDEKIKYLMDYEYWLRVGNKTNWSFMDIVVSNYRHWSDGNSSSNDNRYKIRDQILLFNRKYLNSLERVSFGLIYELSYYYRKLRDLKMNSLF